MKKLTDEELQTYEDYVTKTRSSPFRDHTLGLVAEVKRNRKFLKILHEETDIYLCDSPECGNVFCQAIQKANKEATDETD